MPMHRARRIEQVLSVRRAEAVKDYLVNKGADPDMLVVAGLGSNDPVNAKTLAPETGAWNRPSRAVALRPRPLAHAGLKDQGMSSVI